jgi:hypothetical protein
MVKETSATILQCKLDKHISLLNCIAINHLKHTKNTQGALSDPKQGIMKELIVWDRIWFLKFQQNLIVCKTMIDTLPCHVAMIKQDIKVSG